jgi:hypothetical protein
MPIEPKIALLGGYIKFKKLLRFIAGNFENIGIASLWSKTAKLHVPNGLAG